MLNDSVRVEPADVCLLCATAGSVVYNNLRDRLFEAPGTWSIRRCPACGLLWLDPRPVAEDVGLLYRGYYTHVCSRPALADVRNGFKQAVLSASFGYTERGAGRLSRVVGAAASRFSPVRDRVGMGIDYLDASLRGRLLDVGCGSGLFLWRMQQLGWNVQGIDPDPEAARLASETLGVPVTVGDLGTAQLPERSFDAITLNHVIEHALDPVGVIRSCGRLLKPGGRVVLITPNVESLGHAAFGRSWLPLDPPRHLFLFSSSTLSRAVRSAGLVVHATGTSARSAAATWTGSRQISTTGRGSVDVDASLRFHPWSLAFQCREELARTRRPVGEELMVTAGGG